MRTSIVTAVVLIVVGMVWIGQGVGWIGGSFMTGEAVWAIIGAVAILAGGALLRGVQRERRSNQDG